jgi:hypothetical protein
MSAITAITTTAAIIGQLILLILVLPWPEILTRLNVSFAKDYFDSALTSIGVIGSSADRPLPAGSRGLQSSRLTRSAGRLTPGGYCARLVNFEHPCPFIN